MSDFTKTHMSCQCCEEYFKLHVMYELKYGNIILMENICLLCLFKHSPELSQQYNNNVPIPIVN